MTLVRDHLWQGLAALLLAAAAAWLVMHTEWTDVEVDRPLGREAQGDRLYAAKSLLRRLGATVLAPDNLDRLPPTDATLVLSSLHWNLFPERDAALRRFVEGGGHLVIDNGMLEGESPLAKWVPVGNAKRPSPPPSRDGDASQARPPIMNGRARLDPDRDCHELNEPAETAPAFGTRRTYRVCASPWRVLTSRVKPLWALDGRDGHEMLTVPVGRGQVSVMELRSALIDNQQLLRGENALAFVAALGLRGGDSVWFVTHEERPPLHRIVWQQGAAAVLLGALALGLALWRGAVRFGPPMARAAPSRRSVGEQIAGTSGFIAAYGGSALHRAQLRALDEAARGRLPGFARLISLPDRALSIARAAGLDPAALARAMDKAPRRSPRELSAALALLEAARRSLKARHEFNRKDTP